jgi:molybdopterin-guanine dinucleotide biosynthesis protein A
MPVEILSFPVQAGKSTWLEEKFLGKPGVFGFITPGGASDRRLKVLPEGTETPYTAEPHAAAIEIGRFRLNPVAFDLGLNHVLNALHDPACNTILVDEVGPLEIRKGTGFAPGIDNFIAKAAQREDVKTYLVVRDFMLLEAQDKWGLHDARVNDPHLFRALPPCVGLVLAGGESKRMGTDKAMIEREGRPAYHHAAQLLATHCDHVLISGKSSYPPHRALPDHPDWAGSGPLSGVLTAAQEYPGHALLVLGVDYPDLNPMALQRLVSSALLSSRSICFKQTSDAAADLEPLVAFYSPEDLQALREWHGQGGRSLRRFLAERGACALPHDPRMGIVSVDTPRAQDLS